MIDNVRKSKRYTALKTFLDEGISHGERISRMDEEIFG